jgi:hypothetical protein
VPSRSFYSLTFAVARGVRRELMQHGDGPTMSAHDGRDDVGAAAEQVKGVGLVGEVVECCVAGEVAI